MSWFSRWWEGDGDKIAIKEEEAKLREAIATHTLASKLAEASSQREEQRTKTLIEALEEAIGVTKGHNGA